MPYLTEEAAIATLAAAAALCAPHSQIVFMYSTPNAAAAIRSAVADFRFWRPSTWHSWGAFLAVVGRAAGETMRHPGWAPDVAPEGHLSKTLKAHGWDLVWTRDLREIAESIGLPKEMGPALEVLKPGIQIAMAGRSAAAGGTGAAAVGGSKEKTTTTKATNGGGGSAAAAATGERKRCLRPIEYPS